MIKELEREKRRRNKKDFQEEKGDIKIDAEEEKSLQKKKKRKP